MDKHIDLELLIKIIENEPATSIDEELLNLVEEIKGVSQKQESFPKK